MAPLVRSMARYRNQAHLQWNGGTAVALCLVVLVVLRQAPVVRHQLRHQPREEQREEGNHEEELQCVGHNNQEVGNALGQAQQAEQMSSESSGGAAAATLVVFEAERAAARRALR